jgi:hypothetical protein
MDMCDGFWNTARRKREGGSGEIAGCVIGQLARKQGSSENRSPVTGIPYFPRAAPCLQ